MIIWHTHFETIFVNLFVPSIINSIMMGTDIEFSLTFQQLRHFLQQLNGCVFFPRGSSACDLPSLPTPVVVLWLFRESFENAELSESRVSELSSNFRPVKFLSFCFFFQKTHQLDRGLPTWHILYHTVDGQNSCTTKDDDYPIIYRILTIPGGAGFRPSTVWEATPKFTVVLSLEGPMSRMLEVMGTSYLRIFS